MLRNQNLDPTVGVGDGIPSFLPLLHSGTQDLPGNKKEKAGIMSATFKSNSLVSQGIQYSGTSHQDMSKEAFGAGDIMHLQSASCQRVVQH